MKLNPYPKYKYSGIDWIGEIPESWGMGPLKRGYQVKLGKMLQSDSSHSSDELQPYLRAANIQWGSVNTEDIKLMWLSHTERHQLRLRMEDLLVSEGGEVGRSAIWLGELNECYFQNSINRVRGMSGNLTGFLYYWMVVIKAKGYVDVLCNKATIAHFTAEKLAAVPTLFPPLEEQQTIAAFLDAETARIDSLIAEYKTLIELLKEKRQALISHAVTKGLNPDAPMKDSGVEWLGEVPEHWSVKAIKWESTVQRGASPRPIEDPIYFDDEGEYAWVRISDVTASAVYLRETEQQLSHIGEKLSVKLQPGTLFLSIAGSVGKPCITEIKCCIHDGFVWFSAWRKSTKFLYYVFASGQPYKGLGKMGTQLNLNTDTIGSIYIGMPLLEEQCAIAAFLDVETSRMDTLVQEAENGINLLRERRTTLISDAVTGKMDVRDWKETM